MDARIELEPEAIAAFCTRWRITELALFGSVLRADFGPESDVDVLVAFAPEAAHTLLDVVRLRDELEALLGRRVDLVEARALRNPFLRREILDTRQVVYAA
jgi:predicted nucleotidyltransferase